MRKALIVATLLLCLITGYLAGCRSHVQSRTLTRDPEPGQHWHSQDGSERIVRGLTREGQHINVWWYRGGYAADRHCTLATWRAWARAKGARPE
jgi:outer membrane lipopolysaccharide assembly protein LptE/RlpB